MNRLRQRMRYTRKNMQASELKFSRETDGVASSAVPRTT